MALNLVLVAANPITVGRPSGGAIPGNPGGAYSPGGAYNPGYSGGPHVLAQPQAPPLGWKDYFVYTVMGAMSLYVAEHARFACFKPV